MTNEILKTRAQLLDLLRGFFTTRGFTKVQTPVASHEVIPERHIELFNVGKGDRHAIASQSPFSIYLQASPEMAMKRLLCLGSGPIFQIGPAFRAEESGRLHAPEFTMVEWYRPGDDMAAGMDLLDKLVQAALGTPACKRTSYREAFIEHANIDPFIHEAPGLRPALEQLTNSTVLESDAPTKDDLLNQLIALVVEPHVGLDRPELLYHYPASQSALATTATDKHGNAVAERFELYYRGVELANGYHELTDAGKLRARLELVNDQREADGRIRLPMPEELLALMESPGLPPCAGVALGFDRLLMLKVGAESIAEVMLSVSTAAEDL